MRTLPSHSRSTDYLATIAAAGKRLVRLASAASLANRAANRTRGFCLSIGACRLPSSRGRLEEPLSVRLVRLRAGCSSSATPSQTQSTPQACSLGRRGAQPASDTALDKLLRAQIAEALETHPRYVWRTSPNRSTPALCREPVLVEKSVAYSVARTVARGQKKPPARRWRKRTAQFRQGAAPAWLRCRKTPDDPATGARLSHWPLGPALRIVKGGWPRGTAMP